MIVTDPYKTTFGSLIYTGKIRELLIKYISLNKNLNYEYLSTSDAALAFIIGYNEEEKNIPILDHPIEVTTVDGVRTIVVDVRKYVKHVDEQPLSLAEITKDSNSINFLALEGMILRDFASNELSNHSVIFKNIATALGMLIGNTINTIVGLDPVEKAQVEIAATYYANCMLTNDDDIKHMLPSIKARTSKSSYTLKMATGIVNKTIDMLPTDIKDLDSLVRSIKVVLPAGKAELINVDVLVNSLVNTWYGPGNGETVIIGLESMATLIALVYVNGENKSYKRTQFAAMIEKNKRNITLPAVIKHFDNYIKDNKL